VASPPQELLFVPLGVVGEIGMNLALYGVGEPGEPTWLMVDCGITFAEGAALPGIDVIMPDIRFITEDRASLAGLVLTHGHEDHVGAVLDLWPRLRCPIYATPFTAGILAAKAAEDGYAHKLPVTIVPRGGRVTIGPFDIEFLPIRSPRAMRSPSARRRGASCTPATGSSIRPRRSATSPSCRASPPSARRGSTPSSPIRPTPFATGARPRRPMSRPR
jgi:hypothetical protein